MPVTSNGAFDKRNTTGILNDLMVAIKTQFGENADLSEVSTFRLLLQAYGLLPLAEVQDDMEDLYLQAFYRTAHGQNLDKVLEPLGNLRNQATKSTGEVDITLETGQNGPSPFFPAGSLIFIDTNDRRYDLTDDVTVDGTTTTKAKVQAQNPGSEGNIDPSSIVAVTFANDTVRDRWNQHVASFANNERFTGGQDKETDQEYRERWDKYLATIGGASREGIVTSVEEVADVKSATVKDNTTDVSDARDIYIDGSSYTGTNGPVIDATNTKVAQKFTVASGDHRFVQHVKLKLAAYTDLIGKVRIETDASGSPSGTIAWTGAHALDVAFDTTNDTSFELSRGRYPAAGTYWVVFERTSGSGTFDGGTGGTVDQVKYWNGNSWTLSTTVENLKWQLIGGIPPHAFRVYVDGGAVDDIAEAIHEVRSAGIPPDGSTNGVAVDRSGTSLKVWFDRPTIVPLYVQVTVKKDSTFSGDTNTIKDIIIEHIGGKDSRKVEQRGLNVEETLYRDQVVEALLNEENVTGTVSIPTLKIDRTDPPTATGDLVPATGEKFKINALADITVTLEDA